MGLAVRTAFTVAMLLSFLLGPALLAEPGRAEPGRAEPGLVPDLRVLVDVSANMQRLDPENRRSQNLELLVHLLPAGARVSIWAFDDDARVVVPAGIVDGQWREQAFEALATLEQGGARSNTPAALAAATADLAGLGPGYRSSVVLLTVGRINIADSPMVNVSAARKMLSELAVDLGEREVPVHTVAFSGEADTPLLRSLARQTGGTSVQAEDASELGGIFLNILEMVAPAVRQPVFGREFSIDKSVTGFLVLAQLPRLVGKLQLAAPDGTVFSADERPGDIRWFRNQHLSMARVNSPAPGNWRLQYPKKSTARVYVESDIELQVGPLPHYMTAGDEALIELRLVIDGATVTDPQTLARYAFFVEVTSPQGTTERFRLEAASSEGLLTASIGPLDALGRYQIMVWLEGEGIQREMPVYLEVGVPSEQPTVITRGGETLEDDFKAPLIWLAGVATSTLILVWYILRRRRQRKLELWQKRAREIKKSGGKDTLRGALAVTEEQTAKKADSLD